MHKKFTFGLIALLGVSLFILGCDDSSDDSPSAEENAATDLAAALGEEFAKAEGTTVTLKKTAAITKATEVPAGVTLVVPEKDTANNAITLTVGAAFTVKGTLTVAGAITGSGDVKTEGSGSVELANGTAANNLANLTWALGKSGTGKITKLTLAKPATVTGTANAVPAGLELTVGASATLTVPASGKVTVAAGATVTVASGGAIILTGDGGGSPAEFVLAAKDGGSATAAGGGGKLVITGGGEGIGTVGVIQVADSVANTALIATGPTDDSSAGFGFAGTTKALDTDGGGFTGIVDDSAKGFKSIEAPTVASSDLATKGTVTFKGGGSDTAKIDKDITAKTSGAG